MKTKNKGNIINQKRNENLKRVMDSIKQESKSSTLKQVREIIDDKKYYPKDIFPEITKKQLSQITNYLENKFGFPLDRLSAHISRLLLINLNKELEKI